MRQNVNPLLDKRNDKMYIINQYIAKDYANIIKVTMTPTNNFTAGINVTFASGTVTIDWGDGTIENFTSGTEKTHLYSTAGTYVAEISGSITNITKFIADTSKITKIENLKTGLLTDFRIFSNLYSGTLDMSLAPISATFYTYSNANLTGITFATTGNAKVTSMSCRACNLTGNLNLSNVPIGATFEMDTNSGLTGITFASSGNTIVTYLTLNNCGLSGTLDLTNVPIGTNFQVHNNSSLSGITFASSGNTKVTNFLAYSCGLSGTLDLSNVPIGTLFKIYSNSSLSGITFASSGNSIVTTFQAYSCGLSGTLNLSNVPIGGASSTISIYSNSSLTAITFASSGNGLMKTWSFNANNLNYINLASTGMSLSQNSINLYVNDNGMDAGDVNHILVDLYSLVSGEGSGGAYTGRNIFIGGTNSDPDGTSGGYDGTTAKTNLEGKGFTVTIT